MVAMMKMMMVMVVVTAMIPAAMGGEVYTVGDKAGWTSIGHVDYKTWASTKLFKVGDTIVFSYHNIFHDVARVTYTDYLTCNTSNPYTTFTSGNDSFLIKYPGHYFFICTQSNHCKTGQKVDIRVPQLSGRHPAPRPTPAPIEPLPFPYPQPFVPSPSPVTPLPAPSVPHSPAPVSEQSPAVPAPERSMAVPAPERSTTVPAPERAPVVPAPERSTAVPVPEIAPAQKKSAASQQGTGVKIWSAMMVVFFNYFCFGI